MLIRLSLFFVFIVVLQFGCTSQNHIDKDQLVAEVCKEHQVNRGNENDSIKWIRIFTSLLEPHMEDLPEDSAYRNGTREQDQVS
jgi:hypothetical protein